MRGIMAWEEEEEGRGQGRYEWRGRGRLGGRERVGHVRGDEGGKRIYWEIGWK